MNPGTSMWRRQHTALVFWLETLLLFREHSVNFSRQSLCICLLFPFYLTKSLPGNLCRDFPISIVQPYLFFLSYLFTCWKGLPPFPSQLPLPLPTLASSQQRFLLIATRVLLHSLIWIWVLWKHFFFFFLAYLFFGWFRHKQLIMHIYDLQSPRTFQDVLSGRGRELVGKMPVQTWEYWMPQSSWPL